MICHGLSSCGYTWKVRWSHKHLEAIASSNTEVEELSQLPKGVRLKKIDSILLLSVQL